MGLWLGLGAIQVFQLSVNFLLLVSRNCKSMQVFFHFIFKKNSFFPVCSLLIVLDMNK